MFSILMFGILLQFLKIICNGALYQFSLNLLRKKIKTEKGLDERANTYIPWRSLSNTFEALEAP